MLGRRKVRMKGYFRALLCAAILAMPAAAYDDFYARRLALGKQAFAEGKATEAAEELRVACFGMLEVPEALTDCTARLALAQSAAGRTAETDATLDRFLMLEARFGLFAKIDLEPKLKANFRDLVKKRKGVDLAMAVPTATPTPTPTPVAEPAPTPAPTVLPTLVPTVAPPPIEPPPPPTATPTPNVSPREAREAAAVAEARTLVAGNQAVAAKSLLTPLAGPGSGRAVRKALLEAAILAKDYRLAAEQGASLAPFQEGEDAPMFYAAIALFETGKKKEAKALAERALPRLKSTPYVDYYAKRIRSEM